MNGIAEIRTARHGDAEGIASVLARSFAEYESQYTTQALAATTPKSEAIKRRFNEGEMWVALFEGEIVGTVAVVPVMESLYIRSMSVLPQARGHHIGQQLLTQIEHYAITNGYRRLCLSTTPFLNRAIRLYERSGFVRKGVDDLHGPPLITMEKYL